MAGHNNHAPTIADVATRAGVSIATVSRVVNGSTPVIGDTAERVRSAISDLHYHPRAAARVLASRRTDTLGLLLPEIGGAFFPPLLRGIESEARLAGYDLLVHATSHIPHASTPAPHRPLAEHNTDGLIVFTQSIDLHELARLHKNKFPLVLLFETPPAKTAIPSVIVENKSGAQKLVSHLIEVHGRRRIGFLRGPAGNEDSSERERGYRAALKSHGLSFDPALVGVGAFNDEDGQSAVQEWLADGLEFDAVFAGDDDSAIGAMRALKLAGRRVPEDISVAGFDDLPYASYISPALTTVRAPIEEIGREAVRKLIGVIRGRPAAAPALMHTELVIRESCGCESGPVPQFEQTSSKEVRE
jgi:DNA-binding LacI/PurR family transcriptional regulator